MKDAEGDGEGCPTASCGRSSLVILAHPRADSFNHALARRTAEVLASRGRSVTLRDLYAEGFDPILRAEELDTTSSVARTQSPVVSEHQRMLSRAELLVVIHPNWWGKPPAMMAGWIDRVLAPGVAYRLDRREAEPQPLLSLRHLIVLNTADTSVGREDKVFGDPLQSTWEHCVGEYMPHAVVRRRVFTPIGASTGRERQGWLEELADLFPE